jgi:hypothetical protein
MKTKDVKWATSFDDALAAAKQADRPVYVDFFSPD